MDVIINKDKCVIKGEIPINLNPGIFRFSYNQNVLDYIAINH